MVTSKFYNDYMRKEEQSVWIKDVKASFSKSKKYWVAKNKKQNNIDKYVKEIKLDLSISKTKLETVDSLDIVFNLTGKNEVKESIKFINKKSFYRGLMKFIRPFIEGTYKEMQYTINAISEVYNNISIVYEGISGSPVPLIQERVFMEKENRKFSELYYLIEHSGMFKKADFTFEHGGRQFWELDAKEFDYMINDQAEYNLLIDSLITLSELGITVFIREGKEYTGYINIGQFGNVEIVESNFSETDKCRKIEVITGVEILGMNKIFEGVNLDSYIDDVTMNNFKIGVEEKRKDRDPNESNWLVEKGILKPFDKQKIDEFDITGRIAKSLTIKKLTDSYEPGILNEYFKEIKDKYFEKGGPLSDERIKSIYVEYFNDYEILVNKMIFDNFTKGPKEVIKPDDEGLYKIELP